MLSSRGLCKGLIIRPEESCQLWRIVCDQETWNEEAKALYGAVKNTTKRVVMSRKQRNKHGGLIICGFSVNEIK